MVKASFAGNEGEIKCNTEGAALVIAIECISLVIAVHRQLMEEDPELAENFRNALCNDELFEVAGECISEDKEERTE